jgi:hypothetical protein
MPEPQPFALTLTDCLREIAIRLTNATRITNATIACAEAGAEEEAVRSSWIFETSTYEADKLLSAVTLLNRIRRERLSPD